jgi:ribosomal protein S27AE
MRLRRKKHIELADEARKKANSRATLHVNVKRGKVVKSPNCSKCGSKDAIEAHHEDYNRPLNVVWFCRKCHISYHQKAKEAPIGFVLINDCVVRVK